MILERCVRFWNQIHDIEIKDVFSYAEVSKVIKDIEAELPELAELNNLPKYLDYWYSKPPKTKLDLIIHLSRIRDAFHFYCKKMKVDPSSFKKLNHCDY